MTYWMRCFKVIAKFHEDTQQRLHVRIFNHLRLVLDNAYVSFGLKQQCPFTAEDNNVPNDCSRSIKNSKASCDDRGKFSKQKEMVASCPACRTNSSWAFASFGVSKHAGYLDTSSSSERDRSTGGAADDNKSSEDLEATKISNSSVDSKLGNRRCPQASLREKGAVGMDSDAGPSDRSDSKVTGDGNFDEVDVFLNDDV
ncbi:hypothetical protein C1H46_002982 [Malus baccata]|uniref:Uncharacterized protein n=1 Tax=Malus baccata TaxID=106549 RepID=A0A540NK60_MALBA|nr:hypothetical protein C1H46_002982 [Malus baccata]